MLYRNLATGEYKFVPDEETSPTAEAPTGMTKAEPSKKDWWLSPPEEAPTAKQYFQGLPGQVAGEAGTFGKGLVGLGAMALQASPPARVISSAEDIGEMMRGGKPWERHQQELKQTAQAVPKIAGGIVKEYKDIITRPVKTFYRKPLTTALDVYAVAAPLAKAGKAVKGAIAGQKASKELMGQMLAYAANDPEGFNKLMAQSAAGQVGPEDIAGAAAKAGTANIDDTVRQTILKQPEIAKEAALQMGDEVSAFKNKFIIPAKRYKDFQLDRVAKDAIRYGVADQDLDELIKTAGKITGYNGRASEIARDAVQTMPQLNTKNVGTAIQEIGGTMTEVSQDDIDKLTRLISMKLGGGGTQATNIPPSIAAQHMANLTEKSMKEQAYEMAKSLGKEVDFPTRGAETALKGTGYKVAEISPQKGTFGLGGKGLLRDVDLTDVMTSPAENTYDFMQDLEEIGQEFLRKDTYLTPNMRYRQLGELYRVAGRALENSISDSFKDMNLMQTYKTPENIAYFARIGGPELAADFAKLRTFRDLRRFQSTWAKIANAAKLTKMQQLSTANKLSAQIAARIAAGAAGGIGGGMIGGGPYSVAGVVGGQALAPVIEPYMQRFMTNVAPKIGSTVRKTIPLVGATAKTTGKIGAALKGAGKQALINAILKQVVLPYKKQETATPEVSNVATNKEEL